MSISFSCQSCGKRYVVGDEVAGKRARCRCGAINRVPAGAVGDPNVVATPHRATEPQLAASIATPGDDVIGFRDDEDRTPARPAPPPAPSRSVPPPLPAPDSARATSAELTDEALADADGPGAFGSFDLKDEPAPAPRPAAFGPAAPRATPAGAWPTPAKRAAAKTAGRTPWSERGTGGKIVGVVLTLLVVLGYCAKFIRLTHLFDGGSSTSSSGSSSGSWSTGSGARGFAAAGPGVTLPRESVPTFPALPSLANAHWPADGAWDRLEGGVRAMHASIPNAAGLQTQVTVYLPARASPGDRLPCVFIAPAGSRLFHGMKLEDADTPEHLPYAEAGFMVVAYSVGGPLDEDADDDGVRTAFDLFRKSQGGYADAEAAIAYALATRREIDPQRLYVAGHSSAGTIALLVASKDARVKGCCAYAPATDLDAHFAGKASLIEPDVPGFTKLVHDLSPMNLPGPAGRVLLFHADDDDVISSSQTQRYADRKDVQVTYVTVHSGGHFDSMMERGIPEGVRFLKRLAHLT